MNADSAVSSSAVSRRLLLGGALLLAAACKPTTGEALHPAGQGGATASSGTTARDGATSSSGTTATGKPPVGQGARPELCTTDAECIITDFVSCCSVCGRGDQRAELAWKASAAEASCAGVGCPSRPPVACRPPIHYPGARAVCVSGHCELEVRPRPTEGVPLDPDDAQGPDDDLARGCRADSECAASTFDGCCTACTCPAPRPILKRHLAREQDKCRVVECQHQTDKVCQSCPARAPIRPACRDARCVLVK